MRELISNAPPLPWSAIAAAQRGLSSLLRYSMRSTSFSSWRCKLVCACMRLSWRIEQLAALLRLPQPNCCAARSSLQTCGTSLPSESAVGADKAF